MLCLPVFNIGYGVYVPKSKNKEVFFKSLSIAGKTGTLAGVLKNTPLSGKVYAKSGTIARVRAYTGTS